MAEQGHRWGNAHESLPQEGKGGEEDDGSGIQMQRLDLVMRKHDVEEIRERGTRPDRRAWR